MERAEFVQLYDTATAVNASSTNREGLVAAIAATERIAAWCAAQQIEYAQALAGIGAPPECVFAQTTRSTPREAERIVQRSLTAQAVPNFAEALAGGKVAAGHLDQLTCSLRRLDDGQRATLLADSERLLAIATQSTPDEFARTLRSEERRLASDDGMTRLERQRSAVRLSTRTEFDTGMSIFTLTVDPVTGVKLHNKIAAATEALFHDQAPDGCPNDPIEKQSFLRAHALLNIIEGKGIRLGRPEVVVVVDTAAPDPATGAPMVDWGHPVEIPQRVLDELFDVADVHAVVVRSGVVLHAPGELNLGRSTRLANRAQRRALRAVYATCAMPGCRVAFDRCKIHHVRWWRHGGRTDLSNLLPVCSTHHHAIHDLGWSVELTPDHTLSVTYPDGTTMTTGPPKRHAA